MNCKLSRKSISYWMLGWEYRMLIQNRNHGYDNIDMVQRSGLSLCPKVSNTIFSDSNNLDLLLQRNSSVLDSLHPWCSIHYWWFLYNGYRCRIQKRPMGSACQLEQGTICSWFVVHWWSNNYHWWYCWIWRVSSRQHFQMEATKSSIRHFHRTLIDLE